MSPGEKPVAGCSGAPFLAPDSEQCCGVNTDCANHLYIKFVP